MATNLENLQAAYAGVCAKLASVLLDPQPSYTLPGGVTVGREAYYASLLDQEERLRKIPGVADGVTPTFEVLG